MKISLEAARVNADLTLDKVAEKTGFAKTTLISWEKEKTYPRLDQFATLCGLYNCSPSDIIFPENTTYSG